MGLIVVVLLLALALAAAVMLYAAYPYRGEDTPVTPLLGHAMRRGVRSLPTIEPQSPRRTQPEVAAALAQNAKVEVHS
jgi:hypothetical protein